MKAQQYQRTISVKGVAFGWLGATLGPYLFYFGIQDLTEIYFYASLVYFWIAGLSIINGFRGLRHKVYSDFIFMALVPILLPIALGVYLLLW